MDESDDTLTRQSFFFSNPRPAPRRSSSRHRRDTLSGVSVNQKSSIAIKPVIEASGGVTDYTTGPYTAQVYLSPAG